MFGYDTSRTLRVSAKPLPFWQLAGAGWEAAGALLRQMLSVPEVLYRWLGRVVREEKLS